MENKLTRLKDILKDMGSVLVAFSGGVDSTFLLRIAKDVLGDKVVAVTARSQIFPNDEYNESMDIALNMGIKQISIASDELSIPEFIDNPPDRCYYCKRSLFSKLIDIMKKEGLHYVADGSNFDDSKDFRPGSRASEELVIRSPLREAGLTKDDIRSLSKSLGLPTWDKPSMACLASRFPYWQKITPEALEMVSKAEEYLHSLGLKQLRVRHHDSLARIEVSEKDIKQFCDDNLRQQIVERLKNIGYTYVTIDLQGYRSGSMNEPLEK